MRLVVVSYAVSSYFAVPLAFLKSILEVFVEIVVGDVVTCTFFARPVESVFVTCIEIGDLFLYVGTASYLAQ